jgi:hypothetical protein
MLYPKSSVPLLLGFGSGLLSPDPRSAFMEDGDECLAAWLLRCVSRGAVWLCSLDVDILGIGYVSGRCLRLWVVVLQLTSQPTVSTLGRRRLLYLFLTPIVTDISSLEVRLRSYLCAASTLPKDALLIACFDIEA